MADISLEEAMNSMGAGDMSMDDFAKSLISSITSKVGDFKKYGNEKSPEQKQAVEQLKQIEKLNEGIEEATQTLKSLQKTLEETKKKASSTSSKGDFNDLIGALGKLVGNGEQKLTRLEENTLQKLSKMADESVKGHSLHVHDYTVAAKMDILIKEVQNLGNVLASAPKRSGGKSKGGEVVESQLARPEVGGIVELGAETVEKLEKQTEELTTSESLFSEMERKSASWAKRLRVGDEVMKNLVKHSYKKYQYDVDSLVAVAKSLDHFHKLNRLSQNRILSAAIEANDIKQAGKGIEDMTNAMDEFANATADAGRLLDMQLLNKFAKLQLMLSSMSTVLRAVDPTNFLGGQLNLSITQSAQQQSDIIASIGQAVYATGGFVENLRAAGDIWHNRVRRDFDSMTEDASRLGIAVNEFRQLGIRGLRRGMVGDFRQITTIGVNLSRQIGSNVESTADELSNWVLRYRMTNVEARTLATNITQVGRLTGVTGDNLLNAVRSAAQLAEHMRSAGNFTQDANMALVQMSAVSQRMGTERLVNPLVEGLMSRQGFMNMEGALRSFTIRAGMMGGVSPGSMAMGDVWNNPGMRRQFVAGFGNLLETFEDQLRRGVPLAFVNSQLAAQTGGRFQGMGDLRNAMRTLTEGTETLDEKIARLTRELQLNVNATDSQRQAIQDQIDASRGAQLNTTLDQFVQRLGTGRTISQALAPGQTTADVENAIRERLRTSGASSLSVGGIERSIEEAVAHAMSSGRGFNEVIESLQRTEEVRRAQQSQATDPITAFRRELIDAQNTFHDWMRNTMTALLDRIPVGALANLAILAAISISVSSIVYTLSTVATAINTLRAVMGGEAAAGAGGMARLVATITPLVIAALAAGAIYSLYSLVSRIVELRTNSGRTAQEVTAMAGEHRRDFEATAQNRLALINAMNPQQLEENIARTVQQRNQVEVSGRAIPTTRTVADNISGRSAVWDAETAAFQSEFNILTQQLRELTDRQNLLRRQQGQAAMPMPGTMPLQNLSPNNRFATAAEVAEENRRRTAAGQPLLPTGTGAVQVQEPTTMQNLGARITSTPGNFAERFGSGLSRIGGWLGFAEGTKEIRQTGLALLHQGEMVVPSRIAKNLSAEGSGPFNDAIAVVRPGNNEAMMKRRIEQEFAGGSEGAANRTLDNINDYNRQQTEMMRQQNEYLRQLVMAMTSSREGAPRPDTAPNSRPAPPPQYYDWAIRPLNQPNYGGVENLPRG